MPGVGAVREGQKRSLHAPRYRLPFRAVIVRNVPLSFAAIEDPGCYLGVKSAPFDEVLCLNMRSIARPP